MSPRRNRGRQGRAALFEWKPGGHDVAPGDARESPLARNCPTCRAAPHEPCSSPSRGRTGRRRLLGYHDARTQPPNPPRPPQPPDDEPRRAS